MKTFKIAFHGRCFYDGTQDQHVLQVSIGDDGDCWTRATVWRAGSWDEGRPTPLSEIVDSDVITTRGMALAVRRAKNLVEGGSVPEGTKFRFYETSPRRLYGAGAEVYKM